MVAFGIPARRRPRASNKEAGSHVPPVPVDAVLVSTLFWKILVTRVNGKYAAHAPSSGLRRFRASCWRDIVPSPACSRTRVDPSSAALLTGRSRKHPTSAGGTGRGNTITMARFTSPPPPPPPPPRGGGRPDTRPPRGLLSRGVAVHPAR